MTGLKAAASDAGLKTTVPVTGLPGPAASAPGTSTAMARVTRRLDRRTSGGGVRLRESVLGPSRWCRLSHRDMRRPSERETRGEGAAWREAGLGEAGPPEGQRGGN